MSGNIPGVPGANTYLYLLQLEEQLTDIVRNFNHKFMEQNISMVIDRTLPLGVGVSAH